MTDLKRAVRQASPFAELIPMTTIPNRPAGRTQRKTKGHKMTQERKLSQLAHDLVSDAAYNRVSDLLHAQQVRDMAEADEEYIERLTAANAELRAALQQIADLRSTKMYTAPLEEAREIARTLLARLDREAT